MEQRYEEEVIMRILIIEDDVSMQKLLAKRLNEEGYASDSCYDGAEGLSYAMSTEYDCILLDLMIPKMNGLEVLKELRKAKSQAYILIMTALGAVEQRIQGLDSGADDYLVKPFALDELIARIRALIRRNQDVKGRYLQYCGLVIDTIAHHVERDNQNISLTLKEYALLEYLMRNQGIVLTRTQINEHVWDYSFFTESNVVDVYIRYLRNKIDKGFEKKLIQTIRGIGYTIKAEDE